MASKHRKRNRSAKRFATAGMATATVTALSMATGSLTQANANTPLSTDVLSHALVGGFATAILGGLTGGVLEFGPTAAAPTALAATPGNPGLPPMELAPGAPDPSSIPDLTFGIGTAAYDGVQTVGAAIERFLLDNFNLAPLLNALGLDPETAINNALGTAITGLLAGIPIDVSGIAVVGPILQPILTLGGIDNVLDLTNLIGLDLADPLNLAGVSAPGLNIITAGPPFSLLKFLGVDLGWVPGFPNAVADEINGTEYLNVNAATVLNQLITAVEAQPFSPTKLLVLGELNTVLALVGDANLVDLRIPVVAGFGLGAFAAGMAYPQVLEQLANQPNGEDGESSSVLGSITVLPLILLRNPGRANGGLFARGYPLAALAGIDTVTPDTEVSNSIDPTTPPLFEIAGLALGGANLIPIKVDGTVEYDPLSDFPAWFNPVSLLNAGAAGLFPTYILRGLTLAGALEALSDQSSPQIAEALAGVAAGDPLALNLYLTLPTDSLPLLEPIRLPVDFLNLVTGANFNNPLATALDPALKILTNLGFTDVDQENGYERTLDQADVITPFGTLPSNVDWNRVPGDVFAALLTGIEQAVQEGIISPTPVDNPLRTIVNLIESLVNGGGTAGAPADVLAGAGVTEALAADTTGDDPAEPEEAAAEADDEADTTATRTSKRTDTAAQDEFDQVSESVEQATKTLDDIAENGRDQITKVLGGTQESASDKSEAKAEKSEEKAEKAEEKAEKATEKKADKESDAGSDAGSDKEAAA
jgi:PE-PPE domain